MLDEQTGMPSASASRRVAVVGAGISGLSSAILLQVAHPLQSRPPRARAGAPSPSRPLPRPGPSAAASSRAHARAGRLAPRARLPP